MQRRMHNADYTVLLKTATKTTQLYLQPSCETRSFDIANNIYKNNKKVYEKTIDNTTKKQQNTITTTSSSRRAVTMPALDSNPELDVVVLRTPPSSPTQLPIEEKASATDSSKMTNIQNNIFGKESMNIGRSSNFINIPEVGTAMGCLNPNAYANTSSYQNIGSRAVGNIFTSRPPSAATSALEQYRLQLYNYAINIERLRCPQYSAAAAMAAAAYGNNTGTNLNNGSILYPPISSPGAYTVTPGNRLALSMSLFPQRIFQSEEPKPQHSYIGLIAMAILSSAESKLVLSDIYQYILDNYPYFRTRGPGWRNSIRHNLSLNDCFIKSGRSANGKGHYWAIHPANMDDFRKGDFRRRKAQRKVRKHMGLSVDDAGTDSPSPPPLDLTSTPPPMTLGSHPLTAAHHLAAFSYAMQQQQHGITPFQSQHHQHYASQNLVPHYATVQVASIGSVNSIPHIYQQSPQLSQNLQHSPVNTTSNYSKNNPRLSIINETTTTTASVIANLYSQSRKRQFDVASLLAPDVKVVDIGVPDDDEDEGSIERCTTPTAAEVTTTKHTVITKLSVQHQELHHHHHHHHHNMQYQYPHQENINQDHPNYLNQTQQQSALSSRQIHDTDEQEIDVDVDVVASDDISKTTEEPRINSYSIDKHIDLLENEPDQEVISDLDQTFIYSDSQSQPLNSRRSSIEVGNSSNRSQRHTPLSDSTTTTTTNGGSVELLNGGGYENGNGNSSGNIHYNIPTTESMIGQSCELEDLPEYSISPLTNTAAQSSNMHFSSTALNSINKNLPIGTGSTENRLINCELNNMNSHILGRYYGTYMAAAQRIGNINLALQSPIQSTQQALSSNATSEQSQ